MIVADVVADFACLTSPAGTLYITVYSIIMPFSSAGESHDNNMLVVVTMVACSRRGAVGTAKKGVRQSMVNS